MASNIRKQREINDIFYSKKKGSFTSKVFNQSLPTLIEWQKNKSPYEQKQFLQMLDSLFEHSKRSEELSTFRHHTKTKKSKPQKSLDSQIHQEHCNTTRAASEPSLRYGYENLHIKKNQQIIPLRTTAMEKWLMRRDLTESSLGSRTVQSQIHHIVDRDPSAINFFEKQWEGSNPSISTLDQSSVASEADNVSRVSTAAIPNEGAKLSFKQFQHPLSTYIPPLDTVSESSTTTRSTQSFNKKSILAISKSLNHNPHYVHYDHYGKQRVNLTKSYPEKFFAPVLLHQKKPNEINHKEGKCKKKTVYMRDIIPSVEEQNMVESWLGEVDEKKQKTFQKAIAGIRFMNRKEGDMYVTNTKRDYDFYLNTMYGEKAVKAVPIMKRSNHSTIPLSPVLPVE